MTSTDDIQKAEQACRRILEQRRATLLADLRHDIHDTCAGQMTVQAEDAMDDLDVSAVTAQSDVRFSLMNMKAEMLTGIDEALARLDEGRYGRCESCGSDISDVRLRAMPFALRCRDCEEANEEASRARQ